MLSVMKPKVVVFDLGKVLLGFDYRIASRRLAGRSKLNADSVQRFFEQSPLLYDYESGQINRQQFFDAVRAETGFSGSLKEFGTFFADIFWPIEPMVALHAELRAKRLPTYIFSNTNDLAIMHIRRNFPFFANFDGYILSYEVRAMKPDPRIYEALEELSGRRGAEILYLDDRQENADAGAARGWQVILQTDPAQSRSVVEGLGLLD